MQHENDLSKLNPAERELELALAGLSLATTTLRRDDLMFRAGAQSARRTLRIWQSAVVMLALCSGLAMFVRVEPTQKVLIVRIPVTQSTVEPVIAASTSLRSPYSLASLHRVVAEGGIDAMPADPELKDREAPGPHLPALRPASILNPMIGDPL